MFSLVCAAGWDAVVGGQCRVNGPWGSRSPRPPPPFQVPSTSRLGVLKTPAGGGGWGSPICLDLFYFWGGFPCSSLSKESACSAGDLGSIPGLGRSPGKGNGKPLQYRCLENLMDRGAW